jgi:hypothetical protein
MLRRSLAVMVVPLLSLLVAGPTTASAPQTSLNKETLTISPQDSRELTGKTYGEWSAVWWQYVLSKSTRDPNNPLLDKTGAGCRAGQANDSSVFFLAGVAAGGTATRDECTVPAGQALFFPLVNAVDIHVPGDGLDTPELLRDDLLSLFGPIKELHASVDGVSVSNLDPKSTPYRACAGGHQMCAAAFSVTLPGQNLFGVPAGLYSPAVADGFYLMVAPLSASEHTINFGGSGFFAKKKFFQDITYHLTVQ